MDVRVSSVGLCRRVVTRVDQKQGEEGGGGKGQVDVASVALLLLGLVSSLLLLLCLV